jgi:signal peptidase I
MNFFEKRKRKKYFLQLIKEAEHLRLLKEDVIPQEHLKKLNEMISFMRNALEEESWEKLEKVEEQFNEVLPSIAPKRKHIFIRENLEVLVVAIAVAMAFRAYLFQPFKIPTSSMYPTLYGITYHNEKNAPTLSDTFPIKIIKWLFTGEWYKEVRANANGTVHLVMTREGRAIVVGNQVHITPEGLNLKIKEGDFVIKGQVLATGTQVAGDHIFVNKMAWQFRLPKRGEIMVFKTTGINHPDIRQNEHYVKRMVGMPGETLQIVPPLIYINGSPLIAEGKLAEIQNQSPGYVGYLPYGDYLAAKDGTVQLANDEYFACGDNQRNSLDSRYWGPVKRKNLVGPASFIYWPFSKRWGWTK